MALSLMAQSSALGPLREIILVSAGIPLSSDKLQHHLRVSCRGVSYNPHMKGMIHVFLGA
jgi:hypothetical protein